MTDKEDMIGTRILLSHPPKPAVSALSDFQSYIIHQEDFYIICIEVRIIKPNSETNTLHY